MNSKKTNYLVVILDIVYIILCHGGLAECSSEIQYATIFWLYGGWIIGGINIICGIVNRKSSKLARWQVVFGICCILLKICEIWLLNTLEYYIGDYEWTINYPDKFPWWRNVESINSKMDIMLEMEIGILILVILPNVLEMLSEVIGIKEKKNNYLVVIIDIVYMVMFIFIWLAQLDSWHVPTYAIIYWLYGGWLIGGINIICGIVNRKSSKLARWQIAFGVCCIWFKICELGILYKISNNICDFYLDITKPKKLEGYGYIDTSLLVSNDYERYDK